MSRRAWFITMVFLGALIGLSLVWWSNGPKTGDEAEFPAAGNLKSLGKLDPAWAVTSLDGQEVRAGDLRGKVLFINLWATWCPPCVLEMPSIQGLYESLKDSGIVFLIVSGEKAGKVESFVEKRGWKLPIYLARERFSGVLKTEGIPATLVINRQGEVVYRHLGLRDWDTDAAREFLKSIP